MALLPTIWWFLNVSLVWISLTKFRFRLLPEHGHLLDISLVFQTQCVQNQTQQTCCACVVCSYSASFAHQERPSWSWRGSSKTVFPLVWYRGLSEWSEVLLSRSHTEWHTELNPQPLIQLATLLWASRGYLWPKFLWQMNYYKIFLR